MKPEQKKYISENLGKLSPEQIAGNLGLKARKVKKFIEKEIKQPAFLKSSGKAAPAPPVERRFLWLALGLIAVCGFIVYGNILHGQFLLDDEHLVLRNSYLGDWRYLGEIFTHGITQGAGRFTSFYRPLQIISYVIDQAFWKFDVVGYHLTNIFCHVAAAFLIFWFLNLLFRDRFISFVASLLFVVHPIHTEAVSYISGRADSLSAIFLFLTLIFYIKLSRQNRPALFFVMVVSYAFALLSRESALILPLLALLCHNVLRQKIRWLFFGPLLGLSGGYIIFRFTALRFLLDPAASDTTLTQRVPGFFSALVTYMRLLVCPFNLHMEYGTKIFSFADPQVLAGILVFLATVAFSLYLRKLSPLVCFAIFWFYLALLPSSNLYPINAYLAEHWLYMPSVGFFLLLSAALRWMYRRPFTKRVSLICVVALVLFYSVLTVRQNTYWQDPLIFYSRTLRFAPQSSACYTNMGRIFEKMGKREEAIEAFKKAIEVDPRRSNAYSNLAVIYGEMGRQEEAVGLFEKAVSLDPRDAKLWSNLGAAYSESGKYDDAIRASKKAIEIDPNLAGSYFNLAIVYERLGRKQEAADFYKKVHAINPDFQAARVLERIP